MHDHSHILNQLGLHHLRALDAVLTTGSVTHAAKQLGLSQSALSHQLARLREVMHDPLVVRSRNGVVATAYAQSLAKPLRRALTELEHAITPNLTWEPSTAKRCFRLSIPDHYVPLILSHILPCLEQEAPGIDIDIRSIPRTHLLEKLESGDVDLVLSALHDAPQNLKNRHFGTDRLVCAVRKGHPDIQSLLDLETYCHLSHILINPRGGKGLVDTHLENLGRTRRVQVTTSYFLAAPFLIAPSNLILTAPRRLLLFMSRSIPLQIIEPPEELSLPVFSLSFLWHERMHKDEGHQWFRQKILDALEQE